MRHLLEDEAKALLTAAGVPVPRGARWPDLPDGVPGRLVAKVLIEGGGRGLRGGVRQCDRSDAATVVEELRATWTGEPLHGVYVEEHVGDVARELYLGVAVDRGRRGMVLLVGDGGVDVEDGMAATIPLSPVRPWLPHVGRRLASVLGSAGPPVDGVVDVARALVTVAHEQAAELLEVNPLALRSDGAVMALDARMVVPGDAPQPPATAGGSVARAGSEGLEVGCRRHGVLAADGGGDVAVVTSGAGLLLATLDVLGDRGVQPGPLVDLGGTVFGDASRVTDVMRLVLARRPRRVLLAYALQFASCARLAAAVSTALDEVTPGDAAGVVVRQRGADPADVAEATALLERRGCTVVSDLGRACALVAAPVGVGR